MLIISFCLSYKTFNDIDTRNICRRESGTSANCWKYLLERGEVTQWKSLLSIHAILQTGLSGSCHNSSGLMLWGIGTGFWVSPGDHSTVSLKMKNTSAGTHLGVLNPQNSRITLILPMPYLLTLLAIMEKLYCAVLSLSSNSLVAMVPSVPSIVKKLSRSLFQSMKYLYVKRVDANVRWLHINHDGI